MVGFLIMVFGVILTIFSNKRYDDKNEETYKIKYSLKYVGILSIIIGFWVTICYMMESY